MKSVFDYRLSDLYIGTRIAAPTERTSPTFVLTHGAWFQNIKGEM